MEDISLGFFDYVTLFVYILLMLFVALKTRKIESFKQFSLANKMLPSSLIFASISSTFIGPGFSIGAADKALTGGFVSFFLFIPYAAQTLLVGRYLAPELARLDNCNSIGDVFRVKFNRISQVFAGISSVAVCIMITGFLAKVAGEILEQFTGIPFSFGVFAVTLLAMIYTFFGGIKASVITDSVQFSIFTIVISLIPLFALFYIGFDFDSISIPTYLNTESTWAKTPIIAAVGVALSFFLGETLIPPYTHRALASNTPKASTFSFVSSGLFCIFWLAVVTSIGLISSSVFGNKISSGALISLADTVLPSGFLGLLIISLIGILMSSQDSVLNAGAVSLTSDLINPIVNYRLNETHELYISRAGTVLIALIGALSATWIPGIIDALLIIYSIWAPTVLVPLVLGLVIKKVGPHAGWFSILLGGVSTVLWQTVLSDPYSIPAIIPGIACSLFGFYLGHIISKPQQKREDQTT